MLRPKGSCRLGFDLKTFVSREIEILQIVIEIPETGSAMITRMDTNQLPIPIELPVVDVILQLIAPDVEYGQVNDLP